MKEYEKDYQHKTYTTQLDEYGQEQREYKDAGIVRLALSQTKHDHIVTPSYADIEYISKYNGQKVISEHDLFILGDKTYIVINVLPARRFTYITMKEV